MIITITRRRCRLTLVVHRFGSKQCEPRCGHKSRNYERCILHNFGISLFKKKYSQNGWISSIYSECICLKKILWIIFPKQSSTVSPGNFYQPQWHWGRLQQIVPIQPTSHNINRWHQRRRPRLLWHLWAGCVVRAYKLWLWNSKNVVRLEIKGMEHSSIDQWQLNCSDLIQHKILSTFFMEQPVRIFCRTNVLAIIV